MRDLAHGTNNGHHSRGSVVKLGVTWGVIGALAMAMYAMVAAATYQSTGFFTPTYHIASTIIDPEPMMQSMQAAGRDDLFFFRFGPAMTGVMIHLAVGVAYGVVFALIAHGLRLRGGLSVAPAWLTVCSPCCSAR